MTGSALKCLSVLGVFISVFPFVVMCEGIGFDAYVWWHYLALYAVFGVFFAIGMLCSLWAESPKHSRYFKPKAMFLSRAAVAIPAVAFFMTCMGFKLSSGLFIYALPPAIIMYKGGHSSAGRDYSEIFGRGWFALYFVSAVVASLLLWLSHDDTIISIGSFQLCFGFGVLIVIAAVLTNQTNIDICTHQRDSGRLALPSGLRVYNTKLCAAVAAVTVGAFLFVPPLAKAAASLVKLLIGLVLSLMRGRDYHPTEEDMLSGADGSPIDYGIGDNIFTELLYAFVGIGLIVVVIKYRRQIADFFRDTFSFLFREREENSDIAYYDEISEIPDVSRSNRSRRHLETKLYRQFAKETDAAAKYRIGYRLMLLRLADTPFAAIDTDNTDIHKIKGENGLRTEKVRSIVALYNKVRYSGYVPTEDEISFEEIFIDEIRRKL